MATEGKVENLACAPMNTQAASNRRRFQPDMPYSVYYLWRTVQCPSLCGNTDPGLSQQQPRPGNCLRLRKIRQGNWRCRSGPRQDAQFSALGIPAYKACRPYGVVTEIYTPESFCSAMDGKRRLFIGRRDRGCRQKGDHLQLPGTVVNFVSGEVAMRRLLCSLLLCSIYAGKYNKCCNKSNRDTYPGISTFHRTPLLELPVCLRDVPMR